ncbi:beta-N-acetylhexosaminidase [Ornithobacterium rhinotracheale]
MIKNLLLAGCLGLMASCATQQSLGNLQNTKADYPIVPEPNEILIKNGGFVLNNKVKIFAPKSLNKEADFLKDYLKTAANVKLSIAEPNQASGIHLVIDPSVKGEEAYTLSINNSNVKITASTSTGIFYGIQSLRQLVHNQKNIEYFPAVEIKDEPRFAYRGMHLDVGRHMFPVDFIKKYIDLLALHKMNKFHWHLTEDQGWRLEIKKYPKLTEVGAYRAETAIKKHFPGSGLKDETFKGDGKKYGGFYTQDQARDIVKYAADRHITVIPEIDMPGHMLAALAAYPELGNGTGPYEVGKWWGVFPQILAPKEETFKFIEDVLTEVMDIFPSEYIHIGGDEAPKKEWKESKQAQDLILKLGLKDDTEPNKFDGRKHTKEEKLQSYFINRVEKFVNSKGRQIIGWDEILEGGLAPNATVMSWRGEEGGIAAAKQNHRVIMTPGDYVYFDHYQTEKDRDTQTPFAICCLTTVEEVYSYNPQPKELTEEQKKYIWGAQANVWTEYIPTSAQVEYMAVPRMGALSEVVWTQPDKKDYNDFKQRMQSLKKLYNQMNVNYEKTFFQQ